MSTAERTADLLLGMFLAGRFRRGEVYCSSIAHDDDCAHWQGRECDCAPDVTVHPAGGCSRCGGKDPQTAGGRS